MPPITTQTLWEHVTPTTISTIEQLIGTHLPDPIMSETLLNTSKKAHTPKPNCSQHSQMQNLVAYAPLKLKKTATNAYEKTHTLLNKPFNWTEHSDELIGIEIEVENIKDTVPIEAYWEFKQDNSLRNNGAEFVSIPLQVKQIQSALEHLYTCLYKNNNPDFSNRTSTHIHVNCRDLTQDQLYNFILLYAIFEKHFYKSVGTRRTNSIFCVPLFRTNQLSKLHEVVYRLSPNWHKYCGLNLLPLLQNSVTGCYGTIEFRHLFGTYNQQDILKWINDILCLRTFATKISKEELENLIKDMNTTSSYLSLYTQVFNKGQKLLTNKLDFEECISNVKRELWGNDYALTLKKSDNSHYWQTVQALGIRG